MRFLSTIMLLSGMAVAPMLCAETLIYKEITGRDIIVDTYMVDKKDSGFHVSLHSTLNGRAEWICSWETDTDFSVREWEFQNTREGTHVKAVRKNNVILLRGTHKKNKIEKDLAINANPWKQHFPFGLESFIRSDAPSITFWSIGTKGQGDMQAGEFYAEKKCRETITRPDGSRVQAVHVRMNLTGWLAAFWHCDAWFRANDGRYLRYEAVNGDAHAPKTSIALVEVK